MGRKNGVQWLFFKLTPDAPFPPSSIPIFTPFPSHDLPFSSPLDSFPDNRPSAAYPTGLPNSSSSPLPSSTVTSSLLPRDRQRPPHPSPSCDLNDFRASKRLPPVTLLPPTYFSCPGSVLSAVAVGRSATSAALHRASSIRLLPSPTRPIRLHRRYLPQLLHLVAQLPGGSTALRHPVGFSVTTPGGRDSVAVCLSELEARDASPLSTLDPRPSLRWRSALIHLSIRFRDGLHPRVRTHRPSRTRPPQPLPPFLRVFPLHLRRHRRSASVSASLLTSLSSSLPVDPPPPCHKRGRSGVCRLHTHSVRIYWALGLGHLFCVRLSRIVWIR